MVDDLLADIRVPYLVLDAVELILREVVDALGHLQHILILIDKCLKILHVDLLTKHLTDLLALLVLGCFARTERLFGNEGKQAKTNNDHEGDSPLSNFS